MVNHRLSLAVDYALCHTETLRDWKQHGRIQKLLVSERRCHTEILYNTPQRGLMRNFRCIRHS